MSDMHDFLYMSAELYACTDDVWSLDLLSESPRHEFVAAMPVVVLMGLDEVVCLLLPSLEWTMAMWLHVFLHGPNHCTQCRPVMGLPCLGSPNQFILPASTPIRPRSRSMLVMGDMQVVWVNIWPWIMVHLVVAWGVAWVLGCMA